MIFNPNNLKGGKNKKTKEQVQEEINERNSRIRLIGEYNGGTNFSDFCCEDCHHKWREKVNYLIKRGSCPNCGTAKKRRTREEMTEELKMENETNKCVSVTDKKNKDGNKILCKCNTCGKNWFHPLSRKISQTGCFECANANRRKSHSFYLRELKVKNPKIKALTLYVNCITPIKVKCLEVECGCEWTASPGSLIAKSKTNRTGCPSCSQSKGEKEIVRFLKHKSVNYSPQHTFEGCKNVNLLKFDFYLPEMNLCIEYDGEHHFGPIYYSNNETDTAKDHYEYRKKNDRIKDEYCKKNSIPLLRIPYWELENIEGILGEILKENDLKLVVKSKNNEMKEKLTSKEKKTA